MTNECIECNHQDYESNLVYQITGGYLCKSCNMLKVNQRKTALQDEDLINHPPHYKGDGIEVIDVIEAFELNFNLGNAIKYILRSGKKHQTTDCLKKAIWYLKRQIEKQEKK